MKDKRELLDCKRFVWDNITEDGMSGYIFLPHWSGTVIVSTGAGWEHISVAPKRKSLVPSWEDMCFIKDLFFKENEAAIQIHPPKADYVNNMPNCLHLWRCTYKEMVLPPRVLVGITKGMTRSDIEKEIKEGYKMAGEEW